MNTETRTGEEIHNAIGEIVDSIPAEYIQIPAAVILGRETYDVYLQWVYHTYGLVSGFETSNPTRSVLWGMEALRDQFTPVRIEIFMKAPQR